MHKRIDHATAAIIDDAVRLKSAAGVRPAANFLFTRCVPIWIAHRVLVRPGETRRQAARQCASIKATTETTDDA